jgi:pilus assembly protein CpaE
MHAEDNVLTAVMRIVIAGREPTRVRAVEGLLTGQPGITASVRILTNGTGAMLEGSPQPDVLILCCGEASTADLEYLASVPPAARPPVVLCGTFTAPGFTRLALRCGAADLLPAAPERQDMLEVLSRLATERARSVERESPGGIITVIGAAGGVGSSFIACHLAQLAVQRDAGASMLIDLDIRYAPLTTYLGVRPELGLPEALDRIDSLDPVALGGYIARHPCGVGLMAAGSRSEFEIDYLPPEPLRSLLHLVAAHHDRVVVDTPRWLDASGTVAAIEANHVVIVLQQSVGNVQNAARLYRLLTRQLAVQQGRIIVVINRHSRRSMITTSDVQKALGCTDIVEIPNDYENVSESQNAAQLLSGNRSALTRALDLLHVRTGGKASQDTGSFLRRALPMFRRGDA